MLFNNKNETVMWDQEAKMETKDPRSYQQYRNYKQ